MVEGEAGAERLGKRFVVEGFGEVGGAFDDGGVLGGAAGALLALEEGVVGGVPGGAGAAEAAAAEPDPGQADEEEKDVAGDGVAFGMVVAAQG